MPSARPARALRGNRAPAWPAVLAVTALAAAGCGQVNSALAAQTAIVNFHRGTPAFTIAHVRAACSHVPHVRQLRRAQLPRHVHVGLSVRYQVSRASGRDLAALQSCLQAFPAVAGVSIADTAKPY